MWDCSNLGFYEHYIALQQIYKLKSVWLLIPKYSNWIATRMMSWLKYYMQWKHSLARSETVKFVPHEFLHHHGKDLVSLLRPFYFFISHCPSAFIYLFVNLLLRDWFSFRGWTSMQKYHDHIKSISLRKNKNKAEELPSLLSKPWDNLTYANVYKVPWRI